MSRHSGHDSRIRDHSAHRRQEPELSVEQRLLKKIFDAPLELGYSRLSDLARLVEDECRLNKLDLVAAKGLLDCAEFFPHKARLYGALAGLVNARMPAFGALVGEQACARLAACLGAGDWGLAAGRLRVLGELCNARVLPLKTLAAVLQQLLAPDALHRAAVTALLSSLPWFGRTLALREPQVLEAALAAAGGFVEAHAADAPRSACVFSNDDPATDSWMQWAWEQIAALKRNDWDADSVVAAPSGSLESALERATTHAPAGAAELAFGLRPGPGGRMAPEESVMVFRLFDKAVSEKDCAPDSADRLILECLIVEMMRHFCESPEFLAQRLLTLPLRSTYDHMLVETILGQLLQLPRPEHKPLHYYSLLSHLVRGPAGARVGPVVAQAFDVLFRNVDRLDPECRERAVELMAFHLSSFGFRYEWSKWDVVLALPEDDCQVLWVRAVLSRCVRLSYWARVEREMPSQQWVGMLPPSPVPDTAVAVDAELLAALKAGTLPRPEQQTLDLLVPALLARGETFSLLKLALRQYGAVLRALAATEDAKQQVLRTVGAYWANSEGQRLMVADLLMSVLVVDHLAIVQWVFAEHSTSLLSYSPWEILHMAFGKTVMRTAFLRSQNNPAKLETQLREEKDLFLTTFQRFVIVLESYLASSGAAPGQENSWFRAVLSQMTAFARRYRASIESFISTLDTIVFAEDCDARIRAAFKVGISN